LLFTGQHEHTIDAKRRLAIPSGIRGRWKESVDGGAWYAVPWPGGIIRLYTESDFERLSSERETTLTPDEDAAELQAVLFGMSERLEMDSAGRVRFPEKMLTLTGLDGEVVLIGAGDRLEVRDRASWSEEESRRLERLPELIARARGNGAPQ